MPHILCILKLFRNYDCLIKSALFNEGDTQQSETDKPVALGFRIELEFGNVGFWGEGKTGVLAEKPSEQGREPATN